MRGESVRRTDYNYDTPDMSNNTKLWPGKDYVNFIIKDFGGADGVDQPFTGNNPKSYLY